MWEKIAAGLVLALVGSVQMFFWKLIAAMTKRIDSLSSSNSKLHDRITRQTEMNNDKFARRDDMLQVEARLAQAMTEGFADIKNEIRASK